MEKILYFEGAGMSFYSREQIDNSDVGNFRIRTAFQNLDGERFYIELGNCPRYDTTKKKPKKITDYALVIDHLFKIIENKGEEDENKTGVKTNFKEIRELDYTKQSITNWINENLNCDFDTMQVLNSFYGYRVHGKGRIYNFMEEVELNHKRAEKRKEVFNKVDDEYRKQLNEKYSVISMLSMDDKGITIRSYASDKKLLDADLPKIKRLEVTH